jgi:hypothetical protein
MSRSVEIFDPRTMTVRQGPEMNRCRFNFKVTCYTLHTQPILLWMCIHTSYSSMRGKALMYLRLSVSVTICTGFFSFWL